MCLQSLSRKSFNKTYFLGGCLPNLLEKSKKYIFLRKNTIQKMNRVGSEHTINLKQPMGNVLIRDVIYLLAITLIFFENLMFKIY